MMGKIAGWDKNARGVTEGSARGDGKQEKCNIYICLFFGGGGGAATIRVIFIELQRGVRVAKS